MKDRQYLASMLLLLQIVSALTLAQGCTRKVAAASPSRDLDLWASSPVIQTEGDSLGADQLLPKDRVFDPGLRLEFGAPNAGPIPSTAYRSNHFSFGMVWWWLLFE